ASSSAVGQDRVSDIDVRVRAVERGAFACAVSSDGVDYRFEHQGTCYERTSIPEELAEQCCAFAMASGLVLAGFDFRRTPGDEYRCLEMNPVPSFLPYEVPSGLPIGAAIV